MSLSYDVLKIDKAKEGNVWGSEAKQPIYDLSQLQQMSRGNDDFVNKMIDIFIKLTDENIIKFNQALANDDTETIKKLAHKIKPSIDQMGIVSLKDVVRDVEKFDDQSGSKSELAKLVHEIILKLTAVSTELRN